MISLTDVLYQTYYNGTMKKQPLEEITATAAAERLNMTSRSVVRMIHRNGLNARLVTEAPRPYYLIAVDSLFLSEEEARNEKARDQSAN